ncbi:MAG: hypothetical protein RTU30_03805 [Candidatus Thorarchaeota archaeon]
MDIPIITKFIEGLKLFWESKRLRWLTLLLVIATLAMAIGGRLGVILIAINPTLEGAVVFVTIVAGGVWPIFFLVTALLALLGLQRFIASDESYAKSFLLLLPWLIISEIILILFFAFAFQVLQVLIFGVAFIGWIAFQSYFSTRTSLSYAEIASVSEVSRLTKAFVAFLNIVCYAAIIGALIYSIITFLPALANALVMVVGAFLALGFNFVNGLIITKERNKPTVLNIALIGLFISLYSSYFIYSAAQGLGFGPVDIAMSVFFLLYTMSSVGSSLASRSDTETRWKLSRELAATFTFFLASGYYFADSLFPLLYGANTGAAIGDFFKLVIFPFVALVMELLYLRKVAKRVEDTPDPDYVPTEEELKEDVIGYDSEEEVVEEPEPIDEEVEEPTESEFEEEPLEESEVSSDEELTEEPEFSSEEESETDSDF